MASKCARGRAGGWAEATAAQASQVPAACSAASRRIVAKSMAAFGAASTTRFPSGSSAHATRGSPRCSGLSGRAPCVGTAHQSQAAQMSAGSSRSLFRSNGASAATSASAALS
ncbi:hypothetical protein ACFQX7_32315 [Luedemannella flava]